MTTTFRIGALAAMVAAWTLAGCGGADVPTSTSKDGPATAPVHAAATGTVAFTNSTTTTSGNWQITVTDLGVLPGGSMSSARAINNLGVVVGYGTDSTFAIQRVMWDLNTGAVSSALPNFDLSSTALPESINDNKEVSGTEAISNTLHSGVYWDPFGSVFGLPPYNGGSSAQITAHRVNKAGQVVGSSREGGPNYFVHPVVWPRNGAPISLGFLGNGKGGEAYGINDLGHVVGGASNGSIERAFIWRGDKLVDLGAVGGSSASARAIAVNNTGTIAGTSDGGTIAVVWRYDTANTGSTPVLARLTVPSGLVNPEPSAINDGGDVVGTATLQTYNGTRAVLWRGAEAINLGTWPGGTNSRAFGINGQNQIVGEGDLDGSGRNHALLWTVVPAGTITSTAAPPPPSSANTTPTVSLKAITSTSLKSGGSLQVEGSFSDPDNGPWSYVFDWGDGSTSTGTMAASGTFRASHTYFTTSSKTNYKVTLRVTDASGATGTSGTIGVRVSR